MSENRPLIDVAVVGAQKAASTSLHRYMAMHPAFATHSKLEFTFFVRDEEYHIGYEAAFRDNFPTYRQGQKILVKYVGLMYWKKAAQRLQEHHPGMKLIVVLRHPAERAWSAFHYAQMMGVEPIGDFETAVAKGPERFSDPIDRGMVDYLGRGHYADQIRYLHTLFPPSQVLVVLQDDLQSNPGEVLRKCFAFCGVDTSFQPDFSFRFNEAGQARSKGLMKLLKRNKALKGLMGLLMPKRWRTAIKSKAGSVNRNPVQKTAMEPLVRSKLIEYYKPLNEDLAQLIGRDLSDWNQ